MTYIQGFSERLTQSNMYDNEKYKLAPKIHNTLDQLFSRTKSKIMKKDKSNVVYGINCNGDKFDTCQKVYIGTTMSKLKTRLSSHKSDLKATHRPMEQKTALAAHCARTWHTPNLDEVDILAEERHYSRRFTLEMLHIIDVPAEKRLNYKTDVDHCAQAYRHLLDRQ